MIGDYAVIGSTPTRGAVVKLPFSIPGFVASTTSANRSGLHVVDLRSGAIIHSLVLAGIQGIYDIAFVPGLTSPLVPVLDGSDANPDWTHFPADWASSAGGTIS
jgi:hypothetical protein